MINLEASTKNLVKIMIKNSHEKKQKKKTVRVLMSTYNGETYIKEQIDSILNQNGVNVSLLVRDDGSTDDTLNILKVYKSAGLLDFYVSENIGQERSFIDLLHSAGIYDYYAFSDQDDVWLEDKLLTATKSISSHHDIPSLYYCWPKIVDDNLKPSASYSFHFEDNLQSVVIATQNLGCTMCFNNKLWQFLVRYYPQIIAGHDAWSIRVCCALNGFVFQDKEPHILYRQHGKNVVGAINSYTDLFKRRLKRIKGPKNVRLNVIKELIEGYGDVMPKENLKFLKSFCNYNKSFSSKIKLMKNSEIQFHNKDSRVAFITAVLLGWF